MVFINEGAWRKYCFVLTAKKEKEITYSGNVYFIELEFFED